MRRFLGLAGSTCITTWLFPFESVDYTTVLLIALSDVSVAKDFRFNLHLV